MLLNYDFLEFENDKKVRVIDDKLCVNILDFFGIGDEDDKIFLGDAISDIKDSPTEAYAAEVYAIEGAKLNRVYEKIRSGLPFGIISAFRPFKGVFTKDFTDEEQTLTHLKNKVATFFSKQPGGNCGMSFKEIDKVQIKATCMPKIVTGAFEDDIKLSIKHSQWHGYPKVFDIEKIESIEREVIEEREKHKIGSAQNLKINQIADDLKQAKVVRAINLLRTRL
ncbi:hypothetical protein JT116_06775 [Helicobacter pylori]|nr:hypothetical protein [Helicobacter pylori]